MNLNGVYRVQTKKITATVTIKDGLITDAAPVWRKYVGLKFLSSIVMLPGFEEWQRIQP